MNTRGAISELTRAFSESVAWFLGLRLVVVQPLDRRLDALDVLADALGTHVPPGVRRDAAQLVGSVCSLSMRAFVSRNSVSSAPFAFVLSSCSSIASKRARNRLTNASRRSANLRRYRPAPLSPLALAPSSVSSTAERQSVRR